MTGVGLISPVGKCLCLSSPCVWGVVLLMDQSSGSSAFRATRSALARHSCSWTGPEGRVARTGLWKVPSEWKFLLPLAHVGEDSCLARKGTTSKQLEHPTSTWQMFIMHLACVRPSRPFPSVLQSDIHTGSATMIQRRKLRPRVAKFDTHQA